jgi:hypothetical protein
MQAARDTITVIFVKSLQVHHQIHGWQKDILNRTSVAFVKPWDIKRERLEVKLNSNITVLWILSFIYKKV